MRDSSATVRQVGLAVVMACLGVICVGLLIERRSEAELLAENARLRAALQVELDRDGPRPATANGLPRYQPNAPALGTPDTAASATPASVQITQLKVDLETSQEWVASLQRRLAVQKDASQVLARAFAERDKAIAERDRALAGDDPARGATDPIDAGSLTEQARAAIREVETIIAATGLDPNRLAPLHLPDRRNEHGLPRGGPFVPVGTADDLLAQRTERLRQLADLLRQLPLSSPVPVVSITSPFGVRIDPFTGVAGMHEGVDLQGPRGAPIEAAGPGRVVFAGWRADYGEMVEIDHGFGLHTRYGHLSRVLVSDGAHVELHQEIGLLGMTGRATGPHLHYEVRIDDRAVNPIRFFKANNFVLP